MLGPQASPPARVERNQVGYLNDFASEVARLNRVARDAGSATACGPSTEVSDYF